jgi:outer membrane lipoprotein-sorting protein
VKRMRLTAILALAFGLFFVTDQVFALSAEDIVKRMEDNRRFRTEEAEGSLIITDRFGARTKAFLSYAEGEDRMLLAFTNPEEKGQKILRLQDEIYLYFPDAEEVIRLQGAALKESVMGSDFSYEDLTGEKSILDLYNVTLLGSEPLDGREQYRLELKAKGRGVAYPLQRLWIDAAQFIPRKAEYYALSGRLLKTLEVLETKQVGGRTVMTRAIMRDAMKKNSSTEFRVDQVKIDEPLPRNIFSLEALSW